MANPVGFEGANSLMLAPKGSTPDECSNLQVFNDGKQIISCWRLSDVEVAQLIESRVIWLSILGSGMPPVCVATGDTLLHVNGREPKAEPYIAPAKRVNNGQV